LLRKVGTLDWPPALQQYLTSRESLKHEIARKRDLARVPVTLPDGSQVALSPGGQNPLIKAIIEQFCPAFAQGGVVLYIGDTENKFAHLETEELASLGVVLDSAAKIPDVIVSSTTPTSPSATSPKKPTPTSSTANPPSNGSWNASPSAKTKTAASLNDANLWATETMNNPKYPLELFLRVITVSLETMKIVRASCRSR
jgi:hypothetical protein